MKKLYFQILLLIFYGCQAHKQVFQPVNQTSQSCPEKPKSALRTNNVKEVLQDIKIVKESGQVSANKSIAYTFSGKVGQELKRKTTDDICIWLYTPDNQIINTETLPKTGKYILEITATQGTTSFNLEMSLLDNKLSTKSTSDFTEKPNTSFRESRNNQQSLDSKFQPIGWIWIGSVENQSGTFSYGEPLIPTQNQPVTITPSVVPSPGKVVTLKSAVNLRDNVPQPPDFKLTNKLSEPLQTGQQIKIMRIEAFIDNNSDSKYTKIWAQISNP